ncbi:uncharacterized protein LOC123312505 [Coccinella septempunctata]|uniref:uncharacterized protein LOC123312505 n=1 Tax=Coccinella septempunctata TaxID=41139 RepID=UPI001D07DB7C|nr:uncharacterized protein LOC123312505 [Coccinella septempunctata]XP_044752903.1 uncharacterized protein LOC123312505 [Coccinella septempunctata]
MADEDKGVSETLCGCCRRNVVKSIKCEKCDSRYHPSCITRIKGAKIGDKSSLVCCESGKEAEELSEDCIIDDTNNIATEIKQTITIESTKLELMIKIIQELEDKNQVLNENNQLLKYKISVLEKTISEFEPKQVHIEKTSYKQRECVKGDKQFEVSNNIEDSVTGSLEKFKNQIIPSMRITKHAVTRQHKDLELIQEKKMAEIINLGKFENVKDIQENVNMKEKTKKRENDEGWNEIQKRRQRKPKQPLLGTCKVDGKNNNFSGQEKKAWFFINRVKEHATENSIEHYIKQRPGFENVNVEVKELFFEEKKGKNKSFLVRVPFERKDDLYNPQFWPENVGIGRFNMQLYKKRCPENSFF